MSVRKQNAPLSQAIQVRRFDLRVSVASKIAIQVIADQKQDIGLLGLSRWLKTQSQQSRKTKASGNTVHWEHGELLVEEEVGFASQHNCLTGRLLFLRSR